MKSETKQKILEAGAAIMHRKGYHHTGIQEVLAAAGVPKGSFYFYFKNKEAFGLAVVDYFSEMFASHLAPVLEDTSVKPLMRLERVFDHFIRYFAEMEFALGCPIGNLAQEMGDLSPVFQEKLRDAMDGLTRVFAGLLQEARHNGELGEHIDISETAGFIVSSWQGALIRMKVVQSAEPLKIHKRIILQQLIA